MRSLPLIVFTLLLGTPVVVQAKSDVCHVYVVDVAKAQAAYDSDDEKRLAGSQVVFPDFQPTIGEEELTTKSYPFPKTKFFITASVFYTDESIVSESGADSILVAVVVSAKPPKNAIMAAGNSVAEVGYTITPNTIRAKNYTRVDGRLYVVGIECRWKDSRS